MKIKKLTWIPRPSAGDEAQLGYVPQVWCLNYSISRLPGDHGYHVDPRSVEGPFKTVELAQAACQKDFEAVIRAAIEEE